MMQIRTLCSMIVGAGVVSFAISGCVPIKLLSENPQNARVTVSPRDAVVQAGQTQQFLAIVFGSSNTAVNWSVNGVLGGSAAVGTITDTGLYTSPSKINDWLAVSILAVLQANPSKSATANVKIFKQGTGAANQARQSLPIKLGTSGGNARDLSVGGDTVACCSGTLGALVQRGGVQYVLSNNHVLARWDQAALGEAISQPGLVDTSCNSDGIVVAHLLQTASLRTSNVDAALAAVVPGAVDPTGSILEFGTFGGGAIQPAPPSDSIAEPAVSMRVAKSGRSTGLTCSVIGAIHADVRVNYATACNSGTTFILTFTNQVIVDGAGFSAFGDSGALIVDAQTARSVALMYAGSATVTLANPIQDVLTALRDLSSGAVPVLVGGSPHPIACPSSAGVAAQTPALSASALSDNQLAVAIRAKDKYANQLMADPAVFAMDVGASDDNPGEAAVVLYLEEGKQHVKIPAELDGVRTKVIFTTRLPARAVGPQPPGAPPARHSVPQDEVLHAVAVKDTYVEQLMADPAIIGVGVSVSNDNPEEAAVVLFVEQSAPTRSLPLQIDGERTKVIITDAFRAYGWNEPAAKACRSKDKRGH